MICRNFDIRHGDGYIVVILSEGCSGSVGGVGNNLRPEVSGSVPLAKKPGGAGVVGHESFIPVAVDEWSTGTEVGAGWLYIDEVVVAARNGSRRMVDDSPRADIVVQDAADFAVVSRSGPAIGVEGEVFVVACLNADEVEGFASGTIAGVGDPYVARVIGGCGVGDVDVDS